MSSPERPQDQNYELADAIFEDLDLESLDSKENLALLSELVKYELAQEGVEEIFFEFPKDSVHKTYEPEIITAESEEPKKRSIKSRLIAKNKVDTSVDSIYQDNDDSSF